MSNRVCPACKATSNMYQCVVCDEYRCLGRDCNAKRILTKEQREGDEWVTTKTIALTCPDCREANK